MNEVKPMPNRIIKESVCTSDSIDQLTWFEEVLFYRLMVSCDDYGRFDGRVAVIKNRLFPLKENLTADEVSHALDMLAMVDLVRRYTVDGKPYLYLPTWEHHQTIRAKKSKYPKPCEQMKSSEIICEQMNANVPVIQSNPIQSESNPNPIRNTEIPADEPKENKSKYSAECEEVITYLNSKAGTHYRNVDSNRKLITARMKEGYTVEDFKTVIDKKCDEWKGTDMQQFIRPVTLFQASKFENYLNAPVKKKQQNVVIPMPDFIKEQETAEREDKTPPWLVNRD